MLLALRLVLVCIWITVLVLAKYVIDISIRVSVGNPIKLTSISNCDTEVNVNIRTSSYEFDNTSIRNVC